VPSPRKYSGRWTAYLKVKLFFQQIFNGIRSNSPQLEKLCSNVNANNEIRSSGNTMKVVFFTDGSRPYGGFMASYTSSEDAGNVGCCRLLPTAEN
jgi:hypothetical protein